MKQGKLATRTLSIVLVALALALAAVFAFTQVPQASAVDSTSEGKWTAFKEAVEKGGTVDPADYADAEGKLVAFEQIDVGTNVTIESSSKVEILRESGNLDFPVFNVAKGTLVLGEGVKLTGKTSACGEVNNGYTVNRVPASTRVTTDPEEFDGTEITALQIDGGGFLSHDASSGDRHEDDPYDKAWTVSDLPVEWNLVAGHAGESYNQITHTSGGKTHYLVCDDDGSLGSRNVFWGESRGLLSANTDFTVGEDGSLNNLWYGYLYWDEDEQKIKNSTAENDNKAGDNPLVKVVQACTVTDPEYWELKDKDGSVVDTFDNPTDANNALAAINTGQACDGGGCNIISAADFASGEPGNPKGFFVQVGEEGAVKVAGATLSDFVTEAGVSYAAPIAVNGGNFEMTGGSITGNAVGYSALNRVSEWQANTVGKDKADGSFSSDGAMADWARTETAGAVILTNAAVGSITGGEIANNRADTGAIVVEGAPDLKADTVVYTGTPSTLYIDENASISSNVGVHHAGAIFIFNGGHVEMSNGLI